MATERNRPLFDACAALVRAAAELLRAKYPDGVGEGEGLLRWQRHDERTFILRPERWSALPFELHKSLDELRQLDEYETARRMLREDAEIGTQLDKLVGTGLGRTRVDVGRILQSL